MIDMNQVLAKVMGSTFDQSEQATQQPTERAPQLSRQRIWPVPVENSHATTAGPQQTGGGLLGQLGALGVGAAAGGLAGSLLGSKKIREVAGTVLQVGAVAAVGGLAYNAYRNYKQGKPIVPQSITDLLSPGSHGSNDKNAASAEIGNWIPDHQHSGETAALILQAMVAAATVDGQLDKVEYSRIQQHLRTKGFTGEEQLVVSQIIMHPPTIDELAAAAATPEQKIEVYTAARLTIDDDSVGEREWLDKLAIALRIEPGLKAHIDAIGTGQRAVAA